MGKKNLHLRSRWMQVETLFSLSYVLIFQYHVLVLMQETPEKYFNILSFPQQIQQFQL